MKLIFAIVIISVIAIIGSRVTFYKRQLPMGFRLILLTGTEYIFLGVILGKMGLNFLDTLALQQLEPILIFGLGWIGFLFGLQFEIKQLKNLPRFYFSITAIQALFTFLIIAIPCYLFFRMVMQEGVTPAFTTAITLASAACCTAQSALAIVSRNYKFKNRGLTELLRYISGVDGIWGLLFFALALCLIPNTNELGFHWVQSMQWFLTSLAMGAVPALILVILSSTKISQSEFLLFLIGSILFSSGLAHTAHHSPLVAGFLSGIIVANLCRHRMRAITVVIHAEKSIYIMLLLILGASWSFHFDYGLILLGAYFLIRLIGKIIGLFIATRIFKPRYKVPGLAGLGLISEGGLAVAIIVNFKLLPLAGLADMMITIIVLSVLISELIGPWLIISLLREKE